eukprot:TRINITY_DN14360_c0_g1_i1.p1 TRINITY_DN14360_c0_g1~~TRINITY_DN14360_c0_g1_i1.p1  ORF type:complete len:262 (-),score=49.55 TRINITY_DN14360_c0_g1_i1:43-828(-)
MAGKLHTEGNGSQTLCVNILQGKNLAAKDSSGTSDPYVEMTIGGEYYQKTLKINSTLNPEWNEVFYWNLDNIGKKTLELNVQDWDLGVDDYMGTITIPLSSVVSAPGMEVKKWYTLVADQKRPKEEVSGEILVKLIFYGGDPTKLTKQMKKEIFHAKIKEGVVPPLPSRDAKMPLPPLPPRTPKKPATAPRKPRQSRRVAPRHRSGRRAELLWDFEKEHENELAAKSGDIVTILRGKGVWFFVENKSKQTGYVPKNYVKLH